MRISIYKKYGISGKYSCDHIFYRIQLYCI